MAKVYVTKYAISRGIEEIEREIYEVRDYDYSYIKYNFHCLFANMVYTNELVLFQLWGLLG